MVQSASPDVDLGGCVWPLSAATAMPENGRRLPVRAAYWSACSAAASSFPARRPCTRRKAARRGSPTSTAARYRTDGRDGASAWPISSPLPSISASPASTSPSPTSRRSSRCSMSLSEAAETLGSVNTVVFRDGRRIGHNTDMWGFKESFRHGHGRRAARARCCCWAPAAPARRWPTRCSKAASRRLLMTDIEADRAEALASRLRVGFGGTPRCEVVIGPRCSRRRAPTASSTRRRSAWQSCPACRSPPICCGRSAGSPTSSISRSKPNCSREARRLGCRTLGGEGMAVFQAVRAFELFTGLAPDVDRMKAAFRRLRERARRASGHRTWTT